MTTGDDQVRSLVDRSVDLCYGEALSPVDAVDKVLADGNVDEDVLWRLARTGLRYEVGRELSAARTERPEVGPESEVTRGAKRSGRWQHRPATDETSARWYWLGKHYTTPDGHSRPILDLTADDLDYCRQWAQAQARAEQARADFFAAAGDRLTTHRRAQRVRDLPAKTLAELDGMAASALGGQA